MQTDKVIDGEFPTPSAAPSEDISIALNVISQWRKILNARFLLFIALVGALAVFGCAMADPTSARLWGAGLYSVGVLWPVLALHVLKGN